MPSDLWIHFYILKTRENDSTSATRKRNKSRRPQMRACSQKKIERPDEEGIGRN